MSFYRFKRQIVQTWSVLRVRVNRLFDEAKQWLVVTWPEVKQALLEEVKNLVAYAEERVQTWSVLRIRANRLFDEAKQWLVVTWPEVKQALLGKVEELTAHLEERVKMSLPTKITMLGTTGAGKTCYMIGMHMYMQTCGTNGFTITSCQQNQARQIEDQWDKMTEGEGNDRWPPGNPDVPIEYSFNFNYAAQTFAQFDWLDYRGGALSDQADAEDRQILVERLCMSDCVFLCFPADYLISDSRFKASSKARVGRMNTLMRDVAAKANPTPENPFPVAIIVTKADLLGEFDGYLKTNEIDAVKEVFQSLFVSASPWLVSIIGVSLGQELAKNPDSGEIDPIAVHLPVTFAVLCKLLKNRQAIEKPRRDLSWLNSVLDLTLRDPQQVEKKIQQLDQELADVAIYAGNQRIQGLLWPDR